MSTTTATEFVLEEFETGITGESVDGVATTIEDIVRELRVRINSDDKLEALLRSNPGGNVLTSAATTEQEDPEPLTQRVVIEPLFEALDYPELSVEAGDFSPEYGQQADYSVSLRDFDKVDSNRLLIEAEPLNKPLHQEKHGLGQVKGWLEKDKFEADFGIATDGIRWILVKYDRDTYRFDTLAEIDLQPVFLAAFENVTGQQVSLNEWVSETTQDILTEYVRVFEYNNYLSIAGEAGQVIKAKKQEITDEFYDDYVRLVFGYREGEDEPAARSLIGDGIDAPEDATGDDIRLFSVGLMNRLIFIKFLEDKRLVDETLLLDLKEDHEESFTPDSFYKTYLEPLFFGVLDERPNDRSERVKNISLYNNVPYLNGGLFRPTEENGSEFNERDFDVRDSVLTSIIELLERYSFSADGGPTDLDPSVLGNVFEKTINHITTDSGNQQKELGAYYTPDEITSFCAEQTVRPALQYRFADRMVEEWGWTEEMADYDDVYALIDALTETNADVIEDLLDVIDHFRALDPACGSGHFLTSVQEEIVAIRKALYEKHPDEPANWVLYKQTVIENVYGVDIVEPAVEIAKLRLWLSIIAEVDPTTVDEYDEAELALPNVVFNVRQGNSLIGYTELMETDSSGEQAQLTSWGADSVRTKYGNIITQITRHKQTSDTQEAQEYLERAEKLLEEYRKDLDEKVLQDFHEGGVEDIELEQIRDYEPFHWVLEFAEVYADGGFDAIVGNPPWEQLQPSRHDYFTRYDPEFRIRSSQERDAKQEELLQGAEIAAGWEEYQQQMSWQADYFKSSPSYHLQSPKIDGRTVPTKRELSALFLERIFALGNKECQMGQVLPGRIFSGTTGKDLREHLLTESNLRYVVGFENKGIFDDIDNRYRFAIVILETGGTSESINTIFQQHDIDILRNVDEETIRVPRTLFERFSPKERLFPQIKSKEEVGVLDTIISHPTIDDDLDAWKLRPYDELKTTDRQCFIEDPDQGEYPVYGGRNINQFLYQPLGDRDGIVSPQRWSVEEETDPNISAKKRIREKNLGRVKRALYDHFDGTGTQKSFVNELFKEHRDQGLTEADVLLDCTEYRLVFRDIARSTDERTLIATVIPPGTVCYEKVHTTRPYRINPSEDNLSEHPCHGIYTREFTDKELFVALGLINSIPFDYLMRRKTDTNIVQYEFRESQLPRLTEGDDWFEYISHRAAQLNCYGDEFEEIRERLGGIEAAIEIYQRRKLRTELDAAVFHAYGLDREQTEFVLDDFHQVQNPRMMTDEYFEMVLQKYDELIEESPTSPA
ncbi:Eco57I restriction-modification methylase domain-containing protein [Haloprofundus sp. MHR1]|uniref:Eco57I restriction-modification methylase domain-containing protein n=1 Tax=Haloprofundus sp. MHR1 TaxID=2572921 RepID=UPI0010BF2F94|nr:DNA methyltransferase [Haloprofundus sp. MHR1]QCJ47241.1 hypothetical protein FCF25_08980 [Haloprofundus sp. MHR1]